MCRILSTSLAIQPKQAYAWGHAMHDIGREVGIVTVRGIPTVDSLRRAVQVSIVADAKNG